MYKLLLFLPLLLACNPFIRSDEKESSVADSLVSADSLPTAPEAELIKPGIYFYYLMDDHSANNMEESDQKIWLQGKIEQLQSHDYRGELTRNSGTSTLGAHKDPYADVFVLVAFSGNADPDSIRVKLNDLEPPAGERTSSVDFTLAKRSLLQASEAYKRPGYTKALFT